MGKREIRTSTKHTSPRPAGMQSMGANLYAQIRQAMAELNATTA